MNAAVNMLSRELLCQRGRTLNQWADEIGVPESVVVSVVEGCRVAHPVFAMLADTLGVSPLALRQLIEASGRRKAA